MRFFKNYMALLAFLIASSQLDASSALITVVNSKKIVADETRNVSGFTGISSAGSYNVIITMGNTESRTRRLFKHSPYKEICTI